jgi:hypothetical protein
MSPPLVFRLITAKVDYSQKREDELKNLNQRFHFGFGVRGSF